MLKTSDRKRSRGFRDKRFHKRFLFCLTSNCNGDNIRAKVPRGRDGAGGAIAVAALENKGSAVKREERDEQFCNVVLSFVQARIAFGEQLAGYRAAGKMDFPRLHAFVEEDLYTLKEDCHFLFRKANQQEHNGINPEGLFDISVGSIFHELMKIKENVYQLECYAPLYSAMAKSGGRNAPEYEKTFLDACSKIVRRARRNLPSELNGAEELFRDAADNLKIMLRNHTNNPLLARMIIDHHDLMKKCFGLDDVDALISEIYNGRPDEGHLAASRDYLEGGWYEKARREAMRVLELDPSNIEANQIISKLSGKTLKT